MHQHPGWRLHINCDRHLTWGQSSAVDHRATRPTSGGHFRLPSRQLLWRALDNAIMTAISRRQFDSTLANHAIDVQDPALDAAVVDPG